MFGVGAPEALFISLVALLVFGPVKLVEAARECGAVLGRIRRRLDEARAELTSENYPDEWFEDQGDLFNESTGG